MNNLPETPRGALPGDHEVAARARAIFRASCEGTDSYHALRLGQARHRAVESGAKPGGVMRWVAPLAGGTVACCALAIGVVVLRPASHTPGTIATTTSPTQLAAPQANAVAAEAGDDTPDVASNQMDMVQNLDFYRWLAQQPTVAAASAAGGD